MFIPFRRVLAPSERSLQAFRDYSLLLCNKNIIPLLRRFVKPQRLRRTDAFFIRKCPEAERGAFLPKGRTRARYSMRMSMLF